MLSLLADPELRQATLGRPIRGSDRTAANGWKATPRRTRRGLVANEHFRNRGQDPALIVGAQWDLAGRRQVRETCSTCEHGSKVVKRLFEKRHSSLKVCDWIGGIGHGCHLNSNSGDVRQFPGDGE